MEEIKYCANEKMAIDILEFIKRGYDKNFNDGGKQKYIEALEMGIEALEKRIPKMVSPVTMPDGKTITGFRCPVCGNRLFMGNAYCNCGQALDWSDER